MMNTVDYVSPTHEESRMNADVANHLNFLLKQSKPVTLNKQCIPEGEILYSYESITEDCVIIERAIEAILQANMDAEIKTEIMEAAREHRLANVQYVRFSGDFWHRSEKIPWYFTRRLWIACKAQIVAMLEADNKRRL